jgi:DNA-binding ferritin-like protein
MEKVWKMANLYLGSLRQLALTHQHSHWTTKGASFYGDHLVFERLYKSAVEDADLAAEKLIGVFGSKAVSFSLQQGIMHKVSQRYASLRQQPVEMSLKAEKDFIVLSQQFYDFLEQENKMTLGLDDMIMSISSNRESSCYLLQQILEKD